MSEIGTDVATGGNRREPVTLSAYVDGTDNNFNMIRFLAAVAVVISHAFTVIYGTIEADPLWSAVRITLGSVAVDVFFVTSGFLVTRSLISGGDIRRFIRARMLRIFPAQVVAVFFTVTALYFLSEDNGPAKYFLSFETFNYVMKNISLVTGYWKSLPGVFDGNPYGNVVNVSLWSLPYELWMYMSLAGLWIAAKVFGKSSLTAVRAAIVTAAVLGLATHYFNFYLWFWPSQALRLCSLFYAGSACFVFRGRIVVSPKYFLLAALALSAGAFRPDTFFLAYHILLPYLVLFVAYVPAGKIRLFNKIGDYSYGTYIYSFPTQQAVVTLVEDAGVLTAFCVPLAVTLALAVASWHLIEKRALALKRSWRAPRDARDNRRIPGTSMISFIKGKTEISL